MNRAQLMGNVGCDPRFHTFATGDRVCSFSLATNRSWKDKTTGEKKKETEWHNIKILNPPIITFVETYVTKGDYIYIEGAIKTRTLKNKDSDAKITEICLEKYDGILKALITKKTEVDVWSSEFES